MIVNILIFDYILSECNQNYNDRYVVMPTSYGVKFITNCLDI